jgi:hypothetical protein
VAAEPDTPDPAAEARFWAALSPAPAALTAAEAMALARFEESIKIGPRWEAQPRRYSVFTERPSQPDCGL